MIDRSKIRKIRAQLRRADQELNEMGADPRNSDRALWGELVVAHFASVTGRAEDMLTIPETVLSDLLADLMHWCDVRQSDSEPREMIAFDSALERARDYYNEEISDELEQSSGTQG
jgi:hypothetical protein